MRLQRVQLARPVALPGQEDYQARRNIEAGDGLTISLLLPTVGVLLEGPGWRLILGPLLVEVAEPWVEPEPKPEPKMPTPSRSGKRRRRG